MNRQQWLELQEKAIKAKEEFPHTVYVHSIVLPSGAIFTVSGDTDRSKNRKKIYPKMVAIGYGMRDFDEVCTGAYGSVIHTFFIPKPEIMEAAGLPEGTDPIMTDEPEFYGMGDIPERDYYKHGDLEDGGSDFSEEVIRD